MSDTLADGRIGWWRFQSGDLTDQSGNGRDLVCVGTQINTTDKDSISNNAVDLYNGGYYTCPTNSIILTDFSLSIWINFKPYVSNEGWITFKEYKALHCDGTNIIDVNYNVIIPNRKSLSGWKHCLFVYYNATTTFSCYIDNVLVGSAIRLDYSNTPTSGIIFGRRTGYLTSRFPNADFDEISMYNRVLTADERAELLAKGVNYSIDTTPPNFNSLSIDIISYTTANLNVNVNEDGKVYYKLELTDDNFTVSSESIKGENNYVDVTANVTSIKEITTYHGQPLTPNTAYDLFLAAEDTAGNLQDTSTKIQFQTLEIPKVATPTSSLPSGTYQGNKTVILSCATPGVEIRFTIDNSEPTEISQLYSEPLMINESKILKSKAYKTGYTASNTLVLNYVILPLEKEDRVLLNFNKIFRKDEYLISLCNSIGIEINTVEALAQKIYANMFFDTMDEELGIPAMAKNLQLTFPENATIEEKRNMIQAKWKSKGKCSEELLQSIANSYRNGEITVSFQNDVIICHFVNLGGVPAYLDSLKSAFDTAKPAYLLVEYIYFNTYGMLKNKTYLQLKSRTYKQIKEEVFV